MLVNVFLTVEVITGVDIFIQFNTIRVPSITFVIGIDIDTEL